MTVFENNARNPPGALTQMIDGTLMTENPGQPCQALYLGDMAL